MDFDENPMKIDGFWERLKVVRNNLDMSEKTAMDTFFYHIASLTNARNENFWLAVENVARSGAGNRNDRIKAFCQYLRQ